MVPPIRTVGGPMSRIVNRTSKPKPSASFAGERATETCCAPVKNQGKAMAHSPIPISITP